MLGGILLISLARDTNTEKSRKSSASPESPTKSDRAAKQEDMKEQQQDREDENEDDKEETQLSSNEMLEQEILAHTIRLENENRQLKQENNLLMLENEIFSTRLKNLDERFPDLIQKLVQAVTGLQTVVIGERYRREEKQDCGCWDRIERLEKEMEGLEARMEGAGIGEVESGEKEEGELVEWPADEEWKVINKEFWEMDVIEIEDTEESGTVGH